MPGFGWKPFTGTPRVLRSRLETIGVPGDDERAPGDEPVGSRSGGLHAVTGLERGGGSRIAEQRHVGGVHRLLREFGQRVRLCLGIVAAAHAAPARRNRTAAARSRRTAPSAGPRRTSAARPALAPRARSSGAPARGRPPARRGCGAPPARRRTSRRRTPRRVAGAPRGRRHATRSRRGCCGGARTRRAPGDPPRWACTSGTRRTAGRRSSRSRPSGLRRGDGARWPDAHPRSSAPQPARRESPKRQSGPAPGARRRVSGHRHVPRRRATPAQGAHGGDADDDGLTRYPANAETHLVLPCAG